MAASIFSESGHRILMLHKRIFKLFGSFLARLLSSMVVFGSFGSFWVVWLIFGSFHTLLMPTNKYSNLVFLLKS